MWAMTHTNFLMIDPRIVVASPWNANVVSHENEEKLRSSIERNGMFKPILVRETEGKFECIGGWHRCEQAIQLGFNEIPAMNLGPISDAKAKEISLADNARYGIDDTLKLSELIDDLDKAQLENILPWTAQDVAALTASIAVDIDNLELDEPDIPDEEEPLEKPTKPVKTHQTLRFRVSIQDAAKITEMVNQTREEEGFNTEDDLTNAGDALAHILLRSDDV